MAVLFAGRRTAQILGVLLLTVVCASIARADEYTDRVNATFRGIPADKRSDLVILPLLPAMDAVPAVVNTQLRAALLGNKGPGWSDCSQWAEKPAQKALIEALDKVTKEEDRLKAFVFAQPYGVDAMGADAKNIELIAKGMYTELGDPPLLAAAQHKYMPAMENFGVLVHVEASRLLESGDGSGALKVLNDWVFFCRQVADRPFMKEKKWALDSILLALGRMRDVIYQDLRADKHAIDVTKLRAVVTRMRDRRGYFMHDRVTLPEGDFIAYEQLISKVMLPNGGPDPAVFGPTLARVAATDRPLRMFSASAMWDNAKDGHAGQRDSQQMLQIIRGDWFKRWELSPFDRIVATVTDYRRRVATSSKYAILIEPFKDMDGMFPLRQQLRTELGGTRMAMGAYGYFLRHRALPRGLDAARPEFIDSIDKDPYSRTGIDLSYFVPGADKAHVIKLYPPEPNPTFEISVGADQFVIYSVGTDGDKGVARFATQWRTGVPGDYLLFPPTISLYRQRLLELNQLK